MADFRPILGNPVEVTHVTSSGHVYSFPHEGTCQILHVFFFDRPSLLLNTTFSASFVSLGPMPGPFLAQPLSHAPLDFFGCFTTFCNTVHVHPFQAPWAPCNKPSHRHTNGCKGVGLKCNLG